MKVKNRKVRKFAGGGMDARDYGKPSTTKADFSAVGAGSTYAKNVANQRGDNKTSKTVSTGTVTATGDGGNKTTPVNFVKNLGYQVKQQVTKTLGLDKDKTKNLNDLQVTTREVGLMNKNLTGPARDLQTQKDMTAAFRNQGAYDTRRRIKSMFPGATKVAATAISPLLEKGTIRNRKFFDTMVLGNTKKGSLYSDKTMPTSLYDQNEMYKKYSKDRMDRKIDAYGRPIRQGMGEGQQNLCPDGTTPPCKTPVTQIKKPVSTPNTFLSGFKSYDDGGEVIISGNVDKDLL
jgi:hypothetical protein